MANILYEMYYFFRYGTRPNKKECGIFIKGNSIYFYYDRLRIVAQANELSWIRIIKKDEFAMCLCYSYAKEFELECTISEKFLNELLVLANTYNVEIKWAD